MKTIMKLSLSHSIYGIKQRMSVYDNETKIYPDLNTTAPQEPQSYRLNKLSEIEAYFLNEIEAREQIAKK